MKTSHRRDGMEALPPAVLQERRVQRKACAEILITNCGSAGRKGKIAPPYSCSEFEASHPEDRNKNLRAESCHQGDSDEAVNKDLEKQTHEKGNNLLKEGES